MNTLRPSKRRVLVLTFVCIAAASNVSAQDAPLDWLREGCWNFPCLSDPRLNGAVHDIGHTITAVAVAEGIGLVTDWSPTTRYLIGTVALPVAQEVFDAIKFGSGFKHFVGADGLHDPLTYQGAWLVPLLADKKYWQAALLTVAYSGFTYYWNYRR